jgi:hypothetical protein
MTSEPPKVADSDGLPDEVVKALELSAVSAINVLQLIRHLGLYEAKLLVDSYLERHPEHPLCQQLAGAAATSQVERTDRWWDEILTADAEPAGLMEFDSLEREVVAPEFYVLLRERVDCKDWIGGALRASISAMTDMATIDFLDEERPSNKGDLSAAVLRMSAPLSKEAIRSTLEIVRRGLPEGGSFRVIEAVQWSDAAIPLDELALEYFQHEFSRRGRMVSPTTSCAKLTHRPTGTVCRSTLHRRRAKNYEEALLLLASLLKAKNEA